MRGIIKPENVMKVLTLSRVPVFDDMGGLWDVAAQIYAVWPKPQKFGDRSFLLISVMLLVN